MQTQFKLKEIGLPGCYEITPKNFVDSRGRFIKTLQESSFRKIGIDLEVKEEFISISKYSAIRGIHFQEPPNSLKKMIYCPRGSVFEVLVDLRKNSPTFKKVVTIRIDDQKINMLYITEGIGHGFQALVDDTLMVYKTSCEYDAQSDRGILWNSLGVAWPLATLLISDRDQEFPSLEKYKSPFLYNKITSKNEFCELEI